MPIANQTLALFRVKIGEGDFLVEAAAFLCGEDVVVVLAGGTRYHVGAVAMALPRPSLADPAKISASASVLCVTGHKEDELARSMALKLASMLNRRVTVTAGVHVDEASADEVKALLGNCEQVMEKIACRLKGTQ